jgi:hypothetical protein
MRCERCLVGDFGVQRRQSLGNATSRCRRPEHVYFCESRILTTLASPGVAWQSLQMLTEGVWSEIRVGGECLRLFSEDCAQGVLTSVYNVKAKTWIAPSEPVENIQQGKVKAEAYAKAYLKNSVNLEPPSLEWKSSRSI